MPAAAGVAVGQSPVPGSAHLAAALAEAGTAAHAATSAHSEARAVRFRETTVD
jgi:hypothetical protein